MTFLRPLAVSAAAFALLATSQSADARTRRPVKSVWATSPGPALPTVAGSESDARVLPIYAATTLPVVVQVDSGGTAVPGGCYPVAVETTGTAAAGRPAMPTARGPPA